MIPVERTPITARGTEDIMLHLWKPVFYTLQSVIGLATNIFVVIVVTRSKKLSKLDFSKFLINQSLIDATSCVMLMFSYFSLYHFNLHLHLIQGRFIDEVICRVWVNDLLLWGFLVSSTYHIVMMSLQKYGQIVHPLVHRKCCMGRYSWITLVLPWLFGPVYCITTLQGKAHINGETGECEINVWPSRTTGRILGSVVVCVQFLIPMVIIVACYTQILITIRRRWRPVCYNHRKHSNSLSIEKENSRNNSTTQLLQVSNYNHITSNNNNNTEHLLATPNITPIKTTTTKTHKPAKSNKLLRGLKIQKNIVKTLTLICVCFFCCWVTNTIVFFTLNLGLVRPGIYNSGVFEFSVIAVFTNSVINPFIYMIEFRPFREVIVEMFRMKKGGDGHTSTRSDHRSYFVSYSVNSGRINNATAVRNSTLV